MPGRPAIDRPYLVIPKLIEQPTWGGQYIVASKGWLDRADLASIKIGQSYELFSGSNLSLLESSDNPAFTGELTDRDAVQVQTHPENSLPLSELLSAAGAPLPNLLIKYTQALGNSFQVHIKPGTPHPYWKPKPESWYFFEPGLITLGVKSDAQWSDYEAAVTNVETEMKALAARVKSGELAYSDAQPLIKAMLEKYDPWQYVNLVETKQDELIDVSAGAIHHSWEEDEAKAPKGNVLYELQADVMDDVATLRSFDKGKMSKDGGVRDVHIKEYFELIDRSPEANNPKTHVKQARSVASTPDYRLDRLLETPYYNLDKLVLQNSSAAFGERPAQFKHLFVKSGKIKVAAGGAALTVTSGHSCFIPASAGEYQVTSQADATEVLISF